MSHDEQFDLLRAKMDEHAAAMRAELNRQLYAATPIKAYAPIPAYRRAWWRVRGYLSTLWDALRGRDPYDIDSDY